MSTVKKLYGRHHGLVDPFTVAVPKHISMLWPLLKRSKAFKYKGCNFTDLFHRYIDRGEGTFTGRRGLLHVLPNTGLDLCFGVHIGVSTISAL